MSFLEDFKKVIRECNYSNTYKMAWAKAIVELSNNYYNYKGDDINLYLNDIAEKMFKYYWDQTIFFSLYQSAPNQPPIILQKVKEIINMYRNDFDSIPIVYNRISEKIKEKYSKEYKKAIRDSVSNIKSYVMPLFLNLDRQTYDFYKIDKTNSLISIKKDKLMELYKNQQDLFDMINYRWSLMLENYNSCPRIGKKVRIMDDQEIKRNVNLTDFDKYLDLENKEHICFICGKSIENDELSRDHVIPWSYMYSDDLWNLVYVHSSCNSSKSNITPSKEQIEKLKARNLKLQSIINKKCENNELTKRSLLQEFDNAIANDYVDKFYLGCRGC